MLRNVFIVLVLAALAATSAIASPAHRSSRTAAKAHHHASHPASSSRAAARRPTRGSHPATLRHGRVHYGRPHRSVASSPRLRRQLPTLTAPRIARASNRLEPSAVVPAVAALNRRAVMPPPLRGSFESLARQNERAEADGLERILDEDDLASRIEQKLLVPVPASSGLVVNANLTENHRYCRSWTANLLTDLARAHIAQFRKPIEVSSAVRTVEYQKRLAYTNGNAAAAEGDVVSPHLTGGTVDIVKQGMSRAELAWMRTWLLARQIAGTIDVEEEFRQRCFHITVYRNYVPPPSEDAAPGHRRPARPTQVASRGR